MERSGKEVGEEDMKKWTSYYGYIQQVEVHVVDGKFTGFSCKGSGVVWEPPDEKLDPNHFWDTAEEAVIILTDQLTQRLKDRRVVLDYLRSKILAVEDDICRLEKRISNLHEEVLLS